MLIDAFKQVAEAHPDSLLFFGGSGALREELQSKIVSSSLTKRVRLLGFIPDDQLANAYQAADLSIVPSQSLEGFGLSTLESLACGTPVLVTPVGGLPEAVKGLDAKLILRNKDSNAIAEWLDSFLSGQLSLPLPEECRRYVELNFSWPIIAQRIKRVYCQVANE
jgi:glycogen synthase